MIRSLARYAAIKPEAVAQGSAAQMTFFVRDAQADIASLAKELGTANDSLEILRDALNDLITRPTDPAARQRARDVLARWKS